MLNTGVLLASFMAYDAIALRRNGLANQRMLRGKEALVDRVGHLAGYCTGIGAGVLIRQNDPRWRDLKRHSFWYRRATNGQDKPGLQPVKPPGSDTQIAR